MLRSTIILSFLVLASGSAFAQNVKDCDGALVKDTLSSSSQVSTDYRMAVLVDEKTWEQAKHDASGKATIYGIPMEGSYSDYKNNASARLQQSNESYTTDEIRSMAWVGMGSNSLSAYTACLNTLGSNRNMLILTGSPSTEAEASIAVRWFHDQFGPQTVKLEWTGPAGYNLTGLPREAQASSTPRLGRITRPNTGHLLLQVHATDAGGKDAGSGEIIVAAYTRPKERVPLARGLLSGGGTFEVEAQDMRGHHFKVHTAASMTPNGKATPRIGVSCRVLRPSGWQEVGGKDEHENNSGATTADFEFDAPWDMTKFGCWNLNHNGEAVSTSATLTFVPPQ